MEHWYAVLREAITMGQYRYFSQTCSQFFEANVKKVTNKCLSTKFYNMMRKSVKKIIIWLYNDVRESFRKFWKTLDGIRNVLARSCLLLWRIQKNVGGLRDCGQLTYCSRPNNQATEQPMKITCLAAGISPLGALHITPVILITHNVSAKPPYLYPGSSNFIRIRQKYQERCVETGDPIT